MELSALPTSDWTTCEFIFSGWRIQAGYCFEKKKKRNDKWEYCTCYEGYSNASLISFSGKPINIYIYTYNN